MLRLFKNLPQLATIFIVCMVSNFALASSKINLTDVHTLLRDELMKTTEQRPIPVIEYVSNAQNTAKVPRFFLQAAIHGDEVIPSEFLAWLVLRLREGKSMLNQIPFDFALDIIPRANPDRFGQTRYNANQVNLNRNFSVLWGLSREPSGKFAFSEAETRAIRAMFYTRQYAGAIDLHGYANWVVAPSQPEEVHGRPSNLIDRYLKWLSVLQRSILTLSSPYQVKTASDLGDGGAFEDWAFWSQDTPAACIEMIDLRQSPRFLRHPGDAFAEYERLIFMMFSQAVDEDTTTAMASPPSTATKTH